MVTKKKVKSQTTKKHNDKTQNKIIENLNKLLRKICNNIDDCKLPQKSFKCNPEPSELSTSLASEGEGSNQRSTETASEQLGDLVRSTLLWRRRSFGTKLPRSNPEPSELSTSLASEGEGSNQRSTETASEQLGDLVRSTLLWRRRSFILKLPRSNPEPSEPDNSAKNQKRKSKNNHFKTFEVFFKAFSLVELMVALIIISCVTAAFAPVVTKKLKASGTTAGSLGDSLRNLKEANECLNAGIGGGNCKLCYISKSNPSKNKCMVCNNTCTSTQYQNTSTCACVNCNTAAPTGFGSMCSTCTNTRCTRCINGKKLLSNNTCANCDANRICDGTATVRKPRDGYYSNNGIETLCAVNTWSLPSSDNYSCLASNCTSGYYCNTSENRGSRTICPKGSYCINSVKTPCPTGKYTNATGKSSCDSCTSGYYQNLTGQSSCNPCWAGSYNTSSGLSSCTNCSAGKYQNLTGKTTCKSCAAGTYQNSTGQSSCIACAAGTYQNSTGQSSCIACPTGKYQSATGQTSCLSCPTGKYQDSTGQSTCKSCPTGKYQDSTGQSSCKLCAAGKYQNSTGQSSCKLCAAGTYQPNTGQTSCLSCPTGTYQNSEGQTSCKQCSSYSTGCTSCTVTTGSCTSCQGGYYRSGSSCVKCPAGKYSNAGATSCTTCPEGKYSSSGATSCTTCVSNCKTCNGTNSCLYCKPGYWWVNSTTCRLCEAGWWCNDSRYYCGNGYTSSQGASSPSACYTLSCSSGQFPWNQSCLNCSEFDTNCTACTTWGGCTSCRSGWGVIDGWCYQSCNTLASQTCSGLSGWETTGNSTCYMINYYPTNFRWSESEHKITFDCRSTSYSSCQSSNWWIDWYEWWDWSWTYCYW